MRKGRLTVEPGDVILAMHAPIDSAARAAHPSIDDARTLAADVHAIISSRVEALERARAHARRIGIEPALDMTAARLAEYAGDGDYRWVS